MTIETKNFYVTSVYKPPNEQLIYSVLTPTNSNKPHIFIGDFNSHHQNWGYIDNDANGEALVSWAEGNKITILRDPKLPSSFNSGRWKRGYNPDLIMTTEEVHDNSKKNVYSPIAHTQHRPIGVCITPVIQAKEIPMRRRFNFKKANWTSFETTLDQLINERELDPTVENYNTFIEIIKTASRENNPTRVQKKIHTGFSTKNTCITMRSTKLPSPTTHSPKKTSKLGEKLIDSICEQKRSSWQKLIEETNVKHSSRESLENNEDPEQ